MSSGLSRLRRGYGPMRLNEADTLFIDATLQYLSEQTEQSLQGEQSTYLPHVATAKVLLADMAIEGFAADIQELAHSA